MKLVIKNLADPVKAQEAKYRQLKLDNAKIREKLIPISSALEYLKAIGFAEAVQDDIQVLRVENPDIAVMKASLAEVTNALDMVAPNNSTTTTQKKSVKKPRVEEEKKSDDYDYSGEKLSEKQKARRLLEEKERKEKEIARLERKKTAAQIKQDKYVRKHDPNWKSGVSAAMAKSGSGIETFRDRHGE